MGKLTSFVVEFTDGKTVYQPGESVSGRVVTELASPMRQRGLTIRFVGKARVIWSERHGQVTVVYSKTQKYFDQKSVFDKSGNSQDATTIRAGRHIYPFNFQLPTNIPGSYKDRIGSIKYAIKVVINEEGSLTNPKTKEYFTVKAMLDLNKKTNMSSPSAVSQDRTVCCLCCSSGPIHVQFHTNKTGYVPGEVVIVNGTLTNASNSSISRTSVKLIKKVRYNARQKSKTVLHTIAKQSYRGCGSNATIDFSDVRVQVPPTYPSDPVNCEVMDFEYSARIRVRYGGRKLLVKAPILIGTIPFGDVQDGDTALMSSAAMPSLPLPGVVPSHHVPSSAKVTPTGTAAQTYEAATSDQNTSQPRGGNYYDWGNSAFTYN